MGQRAKQTRIQGLLLRCGFVALMIGLIAFSIYQLAQHITAGAQTLRTQTITDRSYMQLDLYLFRNEQVLTVGGGDRLFVYCVRDGEKVGVGDTVAQVYAAGPGTDNVAATQQALNGYSTQIALLQQHSGSGTPTNAEAALQAVDRQYVGMLAAADRGQLGVANGFASLVADGLNRYQVLTGAWESTGNAVSRLQAEQAALVAGCTRESDAVMATGGYFYYDVDGYESLFPYDKALTMTPAEFLAMTQGTAQDTYGDGAVVGKLVTSSVWYAAAYLTAEEAACLEEGRTYTVTCRNSAGTELPMTVCRLVADTAGDGVLAVFETQSMPDGFSYERRLSVQTVSEEVSGYRVPAEAVVTRTDGDGRSCEGVYILVGNVVEFRRILTRRSYEGYRIVLTNGEVAAYLEEIGEEADAGDYLTLNDLILLTPSGVSEGDMLE